MVGAIEAVDMGETLPLLAEKGLNDVVVVVGEGSLADELAPALAPSAFAASALRFTSLLYSFSLGVVGVGRLDVPRDTNRCLCAPLVLVLALPDASAASRRALPARVRLPILMLCVGMG